MPDDDDKAVMTTEMAAAYPEPVLSQGPIGPSHSQPGQAGIGLAKEFVHKIRWKHPSKLLGQRSVTVKVEGGEGTPCRPGPGSWLSPSWFEAPVLVRGGCLRWSHAPGPAGPPGITRKLALPGCRSPPCGAPSTASGALPPPRWLRVSIHWPPAAGPASSSLRASQPPVCSFGRHPGRALMPSPAPSHCCKLLLLQGRSRGWWGPGLRLGISGLSGHVHRGGLTTSHLRLGSPGPAAQRSAELRMVGGQRGALSSASLTPVATTPDDPS